MDKQAYLQMAEEEDTHWWYLGRRAILRDLLKRYAPEISGRKMCLLDAGCGSGGNLPLLSEFGDTYGFERDETARSHAQHRNIGVVEGGEFPNAIPFLDTQFDVIICCDVLEHLAEPAAALQSLNARLAPEGAIIITVPCYRWMWSRHDEFHHHLRRYTRNQLQQLLLENGFNVHFISYFNFWLFPLAILARLIDKFFPPHSKPLGSNTPHKILNQILYRIFSSERFILGKAPFGLSLIAIAGKNRA